MKEVLKMVCEELTKSNPKERFVFGIDGLSRSGKTTFAKMFVEKLAALNIEYCLFHIDDFIVERSKRYGTGLEEWREYYEMQWPVNQLTETFFSKLKNASHIKMSFYDGATDASVNQTITIPKRALIIVEGVFLQRAEWKGYFDKVIYLKCSRSTRFYREAIAVQQNTDKMERRYWKAERYYEQMINPEQQADRVVHCTEKGRSPNHAE